MRVFKPNAIVVELALFKLALEFDLPHLRLGQVYKNVNGRIKLTQPRSVQTDPPRALDLLASNGSLFRFRSVLGPQKAAGHSRRLPGKHLAARLAQLVLLKEALPLRRVEATADKRLASGRAESLLELTEEGPHQAEVNLGGLIWATSPGHHVDAEDTAAHRTADAARPSDTSAKPGGDSGNQLGLDASAFHAEESKINGTCQGRAAC